MTTTAFQWVFDKAESISINRRAVVASTTTRDQTIRSVSRGGQVWRFDVKMPDGLAWDTNRSYIEAIDYADKFTKGTVQINNAGYNSWLTPYQGDSVNSTGFYATWTQGATTITLTTSPTTTSGFKFRSGDLIQLGSTGAVYSVVADVPYNSNTVNLNRAILDNSATAINLVVGVNVTWTVICVEMPGWSIFSRNQIGWSGSFKFIEALV